MLIWMEWNCLICGRWHSWAIFGSAATVPDGWVSSGRQLSISGGLRGQRKTEHWNHNPFVCIQNQVPRQLFPAERKPRMCFYQQDLRIYDECKRRFSVRLWKIFTDCFNCLPVAAVIDDKILWWAFPRNAQLESGGRYREAHWRAGPGPSVRSSLGRSR